MNKREIKMISYDFRCSASAVMTSHYADLFQNIQSFMSFIKQNSLIMQYINSLPETNANIEGAINAVATNCNTMFCLGETNEERFVNTFKLLDSPSLDAEKVVRIFLAYRNGSRQYQDMAKNFCQRIILPFIRTIEQYLTKIEIKMGLDDNIQYAITINGGQVNLSQDNSTINAVQNNSGIDVEQIQKMTNDILAVAKAQNVPNDVMKQLIESLDVIKDELKKPSPKQSVIQMLLNGLTASGSILGTIPVLATKINEFAQYIAPLLP